MSFGYSVGDFLSLTKLAWDVVQNTQRACGEHAALTRDLLGLHTVVQRLELEVSNPQSLLNRKDDNPQEEIARLATDCNKLLQIMTRILEKYKELSDEGRSVTQFWQKVRFGNGGMQDMKDLRLKILTCTSAITLFLNLLVIGSQGRVEQFMGSQDQEMKNMRHSLNWVAASLQAKSNGECSVLTSRIGDDKTFWKGLRRELIDEGFSSEVLRRHKTAIKQYVLELGDSGALDDISNAGDELPTQTQPSSAPSSSLSDSGGSNVDHSISVLEGRGDEIEESNGSDAEDVVDTMDADYEEDIDKHEAKDTSADLEFDGSWDHQSSKGLDDSQENRKETRNEIEEDEDGDEDGEDEKDVGFFGYEASTEGQGLSRLSRNVLPTTGENSDDTADEQNCQNSGFGSQEDRSDTMATREPSMHPPTVNLNEPSQPLSPEIDHPPVISMDLSEFPSELPGGHGASSSAANLSTNEPDNINPKQSFTPPNPLKGILKNASRGMTESKEEKPTVSETRIDSETSEGNTLLSWAYFHVVDEVDWPNDKSRQRLVDRMSKPIEYGDLMNILSKHFVSEDQRIVECLRLSGAAVAKFGGKNAGLILLKSRVYVPRRLSHYGTISGYNIDYNGFIPRRYRIWDPLGS
ncbi:hypothetical protein BDZ45DRAFT_672611 [Acephala macrosclerotiorum]|nr:hypothetical protein BDZ45DRAFT_672611 [Acephala macrosclerotiorum]